MGLFRKGPVAGHSQRYQPGRTRPDLIQGYLVFWGNLIMPEISLENRGTGSPDWNLIGCLGFSKQLNLKQVIGNFKVRRKFSNERFDKERYSLSDSRLNQYLEMIHKMGTREIWTFIHTLNGLIKSLEHAPLSLTRTSICASEYELE